MIAMLLLSLAGIGLIYIISYFYAHFTFWRRQGIPGHNFASFEWARKPFHEVTLNDAAKYGRIYGAYLPTSKVLFVNDAKLARDICIKEFHKYPIRNTFFSGSTNISKSLFFMDANNDWKRIRSIVTPAFTSGKLRAMMTPIERITQNFIQHMRPLAKSGEEFDLKRFIGGFTMDVIASCGYGVEIDSVAQPNHPLVVNVKRILNVDASFGMIVSSLFPSIARLFKIEAFDKEAVKFFDDLTFQIIEKRMKQTTAKQTPDLLGLMIDSNKTPDQHTNGHGPSNGHDANGAAHHNNNKPKGISRDEMSGQGILFFIAGFDTTHATFDHVIYYLTKYPEWQEKLYAELNAVRDELNYEKLKDLPLLNAIINETLRLCPPLLEFTRVSDCDTQLLDTGIHIPKGTQLEFQPLVIHRDPEYFPDPLAFKPERFLDKSQALESSFAFMPFGIGPRLCVGMRFAQNELRIGLANLVLNYKISADPNLKLEYFNGSILFSPKSLKVRIAER